MKKEKKKKINKKIKKKNNTHILIGLIKIKNGTHHLRNLKKQRLLIMIIKIKISIYILKIVHNKLNKKIFLHQIGTWQGHGNLF